MQIKIHNIETGEIVEREMNGEELAQLELDEANAKTAAQAKAEAQAKRSVALAKLEALGLDEADLKALGL
jgi:hypothetical protein